MQQNQAKSVQIGAKSDLDHSSELCKKLKFDHPT